MHRLLITILLLISGVTAAQFRGLIVNEFSQGDQGSREYIELLVSGQRTCTDSTVDLRGWIVDDQNGWYGTASITAGHYRFPNITAWEKVPIGSLILLYNSTAGQKNLSITLPDDPTDANNDGVFVLPINASAYLEEHDNEPTTTSGVTYVYPPATSTAGYSGTSNRWSQHIGLTNGVDLVCTISPQDRTTHFFSIGNGLGSLPPYKVPTVSVPAVNGGFNCFLAGNNPVSPNDWTIAAVPTQETPGAPNGGANTAWIAAMRTTPKPLRTFTTDCTTGPYSFFGQTFTATGSYTVMATGGNGCVDTNELYLVVLRTETKDTAGCDSVMYKGTVYRSNATVTERISSVVINCDSVVRTVRIQVKRSTASVTRACLAPGQSITFNGQVYTATGRYTTTLINAQGCDSLAHLWVVKTARDTVRLSGCGSVTYGGQNYTTSAQRTDTLRSTTQACDSVFRTAIITVNQPANVSVNVCSEDGQSVAIGGNTVTVTGLYRFVLKTVAGCDSTVNAYAMFRKTVRDTLRGCDSVLYKSQWRFSNTLFTDTVPSVVNGCDSVLALTVLLVNKSSYTQLRICLPVGGSHLFAGQTLTASDTYTTVLKTSAGCDSTVQLRLTVAQQSVQTHRGCDSVRWNGQTLFASAIFRDTLRTADGCDSLLRIDSIVVNRTKHTVLNVCLKPGEGYNFNGQTLTASGEYSTVFNTPTCDSIVQLRLVVAALRTQTLRDCRQVVYNGQTYTVSGVVHDTVRSLAGCDSLWRRTTILIELLPHTYDTVCLPPAGTHVFNGQTLTASGNFTATFRTRTGCDSTVHLRLLVATATRQTISGCGVVVHKGVAYTASTVVRDTLRSVLTGCDSVVNTTTIVVNQNPMLQVSADTTICRWGTATLVASSPGLVPEWAGIGRGDTVRVSPGVTTTFAVSATDGNGCNSAASVVVRVQDFQLSLSTSNNTILGSGRTVCTAVGSLSCTISSWEPAILFPNQRASTQSLFVDSTVLVTATAQTRMGCSDTANLLVMVTPLDDVYIPSAFTPNGDGRNDELRVVGSSIVALEFRIYNRWGEAVFASTDKSRGWDGRRNGQLQPPGTFVYVARVKKTNGRWMEKRGTVVLIR